MRKWLLLLGGLLVWAAHFFLLYAFASIFPGQAVARWLTGLATILAVAVNAAIIWPAMHAMKNGDGDRFDAWTWRVGFAGAALSTISVLWQGLPALV